MRKYDYNKLLDATTFQYLAKDIIEALENTRYEIFSENKDQGIDLRNITEGKTTIVQVKRYKTFNSLYNNLKDSELEKVENLKPDRYIMITSCPLTVGNKDKIKNLFNQYIINEKDIIGCEDLNSILSKPEYKKIEDEYYQLWINSTNTLKDTIKKELNADTYILTKNELECIQESSKVYVKNEYFEKALKMINEKRCLLLCGEPGIGKTTLAHNLCAYLINQNKNTEFIYDTKVSNILKLISEEKSQIFFVDDFWGSKFNDDLKGEEENNLKKAIQIISKSNNKVLILTSREYILSQGYAKYPELEEFFDKYKLNLHIEDFSDLFKARILFKHLKESELDIKDIYRIVGGYELIIKNDNYRPRIIKHYIDYISRREIDPEDYLEDFIQYLNSPNKLWKEVFEKQHEGAQIITILMLTLGVNQKLKDVKMLYNNYLDNNIKVKARKKDFMKYIVQLENTLITTYEDTYNGDEEIFVKFKNSSIDLYIFKYFIDNLEEYADTIIKSTPFIDVLSYLMNAFSTVENKENAVKIHESIGINREVSNEMKKLIIKRICNDFDSLAWMAEKDDFFSECEIQIEKIQICIKIYQNFPNDELKKMIEKRVKKIVEEIDKIHNYHYEDLLLNCIYECMQQEICNGFNIENILEKMLQDITYSDQFIELNEYKEYFPTEYERFYHAHKLEIITKIYEIIISDANFFWEYEEEESYLKGLMKYTIPEIFEIFKLDYDKEFVNEFYNITGEKLPYVEKEEFDNEEMEQELDTHKLEKEEEKEIIEREKRAFLDSLYVRTIEQDEVEEFLYKNLKNKKMIVELLNLFYDYERNYIRGFMENGDDLQLLTNLLNKINRIPTNSKDFFEALLDYMKDNGITDKDIKELRKIAYRTFEENREYIFKKELLEYLSEETINQMVKMDFMYKLRSKYYFSTIYLHLYLALVELVKNNRDLSSIYNDFETGNFADLFYDLCYTYSDIDLEKFNVRFLKPEIDKLINIVTDKNRQQIRKKLFCELANEIDIDLDDTNIITGGISNSNSMCIAMEYLGLDMFDMVNKEVNREKTKELIIKVYEKHPIMIDLQKDILDENKFKVMEALGIIKYIDDFYTYLLNCSKILEKNPKENLRMTFMQKNNEKN